jgi:hypothetical protein
LILVEGINQRVTIQRELSNQWFDHRGTQVQKCIHPLLLLLLATATSGCAATAPSDEAPTKPTPLVNVDAFPEAYRGPARTVAKSLAENGERAEEFYVNVEPKEEGQVLIFHLWHESAFEPRNHNVPGNPGGKCRDARYDVRQRKVTQISFWQ